MVIWAISSITLHIVSNHRQCLPITICRPVGLHWYSIHQPYIPYDNFVYYTDSNSKARAVLKLWSTTLYLEFSLVSEEEELHVFIIGLGSTTYMYRRPLPECVPHICMYNRLSSLYTVFNTTLWMLQLHESKCLADFTVGIQHNFIHQQNMEFWERTAYYPLCA